MFPLKLGRISKFKIVTRKGSLLNTGNLLHSARVIRIELSNTSERRPELVPYAAILFENVLLE